MPRFQPHGLRNPFLSSNTPWNNILQNVGTTRLIQKALLASIYEDSKTQALASRSKVPMVLVFTAENGDKEPAPTLESGAGVFPLKNAI